MYSTPYHRTLYVLSFVLGSYFSGSAAAPLRRAVCDNFDLDFPKGSDWVGPKKYLESVGGNRTYSIPGSNANVLELHVTRPEEQVTPKDGVNDKIAEMAKLNTTSVFTTKGSVTVDAEFPSVRGIVSSIKLIGQDYGPEIDLEVTGRDPDQVQTNMFVGSQGDFGLSNMHSTTGRQKYTISWNETEIVWSVKREGGGQMTRVLHKDEAKLADNTTIYPSAPMRVQISLWDASYNNDTAAWAGGPVKWDEVKERPTMTIHHVKVDCE